MAVLISLNQNDSVFLPTYLCYKQWHRSPDRGEMRVTQSLELGANPLTLTFPCPASLLCLSTILFKTPATFCHHFPAEAVTMVGSRHHQRCRSVMCTVVLAQITAQGLPSV